ncbi:hypothetical protein AVEN_253729-1 [Araneus ventricosus]|uniref:Uncharacterized protein n=1 Tax=Araneus ventricosus TaxID=182803 RepID=A0A4Y2DXX9_ARAVE|nr:hypothetical protein AVEN_253729-1 [Araneus ventricosus]
MSISRTLALSGICHPVCPLATLGQTVGNRLYLRGTFRKFATDSDTFVVQLNQFEETMLVKIGAQRLKEALHSLNANLIVPIVLTSMQGKVESLIRQDQDCRARPGLFE